jgi:hypothetical protein
MATKTEMTDADILELLAEVQAELYRRVDVFADKERRFYGLDGSDVTGREFDRARAVLAGFEDFMGKFATGLASSRVGG